MFFDKILPADTDLFHFQTSINRFQQIAIEKHNISQYLFKTYHTLSDMNLSAVCLQNAIMLEQEAENWTKLASYFTLFLEKGMFMFLPNALSFAPDMKLILEDIESIEENIIGETMV